MSSLKPAFLKSNGLLICVPVVNGIWLSLKTGMCFEQKEGSDKQLHCHKVSAKQAVQKQQHIKGDVLGWMTVIVRTLTGWGKFAFYCI